MIDIGVLAFQGSVREHISFLSRIDGVNAALVKTPGDLKGVSGLILPGGESTTIGKLLRESGLGDYIKERVISGMPVWGTCAGMILMAREISGEEKSHLDLMDIKVRRNAYGSQLDSFITQGVIGEVSEGNLPMVFIRAPWVEEAGSNVKVLYSLDDKIVAARQGNMLATSFHPELTDNLDFHKYFVRMAEESPNL
ncbi:MAG: pyridoxal 5'-phosphate synthase glutaminase subunit PdxT [Bacillota bacterium]